MIHQGENAIEEELVPEPRLLIESLRDIGYSFESALADIVDNSITANAREIRIFARPVKNPTIAIIDDGEGLTKEELFEAMRLGSNDPRTTRRKDDLGRFGLGMKTASFSQCRRLTVVSRKNGKTAAFTWDLDEVDRSNRWLLIENQKLESIPEYNALGDHGTLVLWENIDRITGENGAGKVNLERLITQACDHLSLVFHRFIIGEKGLEKVAFFMNNQPIEAIDPFNANHPSTSIGMKETIAPGVVVQPYTLPHRSLYTTQAEYEKYALSGGYLKNQGFYLYRAKRLIIHGTWFGLEKKTALTQLTRIQIDIGTEQDSTWKIDIKKISAQLPESVRERLKNLVHKLKEPSERIYRNRSVRVTSENSFPIWNRVENRDKQSYAINTDHPVIQTFEDSLSPELKASFKTVIALIENGLPLDALFYDISKNADSLESKPLPDDEFKETVTTFFNVLRQQGIKEETVLTVMSSNEPFKSRWQDVLSILSIIEA